MAVYEFDMVQGKRGSRSKSPRKNGEVQYSTYSVSKDVCNKPNFKSGGFHFDFRGKLACEFTILENLLTLHANFRIPIGSTETAISDSGLSTYYFLPTDLTEAGFVNAGPEYRKMHQSGIFAEYVATSFVSEVFDQCGFTQGDKLETLIQRYGFDDDTCQVVDLGTLTLTSIIGISTNYQGPNKWVAAFDDDGRAAATKFGPNLSLLIDYTGDGTDLQSAVIEPAISNINDLNGTKLTIGVDA